MREIKWRNEILGMRLVSHLNIIVIIIMKLICMRVLSDFSLNTKNCFFSHYSNSNMLGWPKNLGFPVMPYGKSEQTFWFVIYFKIISLCKHHGYSGLNLCL